MSALLQWLITLIKVILISGRDTKAQLEWVKNTGSEEIKVTITEYLSRRLATNT